MNLHPDSVRGRYFANVIENLEIRAIDISSSDEVVLLHKIGLQVDTGNESGALKLYEKVGFKPESSWIQMHRPNQ